MNKVQATLEFSLRLKQFQNLFLQSRLSQIKTSFEIMTTIPHTIEARIFHTEDNVTYPASVEDSVFFSCEFETNDTTCAVRIDDVVIYTVNILLDESKIEETLNSLESKMIFGLYSAQNHNELSKCKSLEAEFSKDMTLHFNLHRGIHSHRNIMLENLKLSVMVHGLLVVLQPPLKSFSKKNSVFQRCLPSSWTKTKIPMLESVIFGKNFKKKMSADGKSFVIEEKYLQHAYRFLSTLRSCLLLSYDGLYSYFISVSETLPSSCKLELEKLDMKARLSELSDKVTEIEDPNDLAEAINSSLLEISAQLLNLWGKFLQSTLESEQEKKQIKEEKFKKSFFSTDHLRQEAILYDEKIAQSHEKISREVKKAPKDCLACQDSRLKSIPLIFEDRYLEPEAIEEVKSPPVASTKDKHKKRKSITTVPGYDKQSPLWKRLFKKIRKKIRKKKKPILERLGTDEATLNCFENRTHLIVCVHGMGGSESDLMLTRSYIEPEVTHGKTSFLMSRWKCQYKTDDIDKLGNGLLAEILQHITSNKLIIYKISFIGFSLGNLVIRSALSRPEFEAYRGNLHTYLSFGGPHMGLLYPTRFRIKMGLWYMKWLGVSDYFSQMACWDHKDPRQMFLYKLSKKPGLEYFKNVILVSSLQDYIVPYHSARIEMCKDAVKGDQLGTVYSEMLHNILEPVLNNKNCNFVRYDASFDVRKPWSLLSFMGFYLLCNADIIDPAYKQEEEKT